MYDITAICPSGPHWRAYGRKKALLETWGCRTHWANSLEIKFIGNFLACRCATSWSFAHRSHMGVSMSIIKAPGILRTLELSNRWADSTQIKFIGTILVCRCATLWSLAHQGHLDVSTGVISALKTLSMPEPELSNYWVYKLQSKLIGTILACWCVTSWWFAQWGHMCMPMGKIRAPRILRILQPMGGFNPIWSSLYPYGLYMCNVMVTCPLGSHGHTHGRGKCSWDLVRGARDPPVICLLLHASYAITGCIK